MECSVKSLAGDGEAEVEGVEDTEEGVDAWVAFAGEGAVEGLASKSGVVGDGGHALGAGDVAQGLHEVAGVIFFRAALR